MKMLYPNSDIYHGTNITLDLCLSKKKKKKVKPTYRPCFFLARNLKHNYFLFLALYCIKGMHIGHSFTLLCIRMAVILIFCNSEVMT